MQLNQNKRRRRLRALPGRCSAVARVCTPPAKDSGQEVSPVLVRFSELFPSYALLCHQKTLRAIAF